MPREADLNHRESLNPDPSTIWVEGRSPIVFWDGAERRKYNAFLELANHFGLFVHEEDAVDPPARKKWSWRRVELEYAYLTIVDIPGITFDDWAKLWEEGNQPSLATRREARKKAQVALSRLATSGRIEKRRREPDGVLTLWVAGKAPRRDLFDDVPHGAPPAG